MLQHEMTFDREYRSAQEQTAGRDSGNSSTLRSALCFCALINCMEYGIDMIQFSYYNYQEANKSLSNVAYLDLVYDVCFHHPVVSVPTR